MKLLCLLEKTKKGKFGRAQTYSLYMPNGGEDGVLIGWRADWPEGKWVEFRGPPYSQWEGKGSDFELVHDALEGRHATVLHTNDILDVLPTHPRYDLIKNAIEKEEMPPVTRGYAFESKLLGPHQGKELNLMLAGKKPFALIDTHLLSNRAQAGWWHAVATRKIIHAIGINVKHKMDYFSLPGEEWRMEKAREIFQDVRDTGTMTDEHHTALGQLLGYSDEAIRHFVGDRPSLSEADPEELKLPDLEVGDELMVGKFKNRNATIKGFKTDKHNQPIAKTDKGDQQIFKGRVKKLMNQAVTEANRIGEENCQFITSCVNCQDVPALEEMIDNAQEITYEEFIGQVGEEEVAEFFPDYDWHGGGGLTLEKDWAVQYEKSSYQGQPVVFMTHSAIEYVWACDRLREVESLSESAASPFLYHGTSTALVPSIKKTGLNAPSYWSPDPEMAEYFANYMTSERGGNPIILRFSMGNFDPSLFEVDKAMLRTPVDPLADYWGFGDEMSTDWDALIVDKWTQENGETGEDSLRVLRSAVYREPIPAHAFSTVTTEAVVPFTKQWAPSDGQLSKIWQVVQALIKKGMGDELSGLFDNFKFAIEQYNDMAAERSIPSELAELSDRHLMQIFEYGKSIDWAPLTRAGFKARQRMIAQSWGKEVTEGITEAPVRNFKVGDLDTKHSTFGPTDRAMLQSPKAREVAKKRIKTAIPIDINVFTIPGGAPWQRDPATAYGEMPMQNYSDETYSQVRFNQQLERWSGIMRQDDAEEIIGQPIQVNKDSVNVLYLSNANKISSVPLTPWMMMHRLGHSLEDAARKGHLGGNASEAYDDLYGFYTRRMGYMYGASLRQMMTTKAGRDEAINDGDTIPELIAQYLHNGRVRLVRPVSYEPTGDEDVSHKFELSNGKTILVKGDEIDDGDPMAAFTHKLEGDEKAIDEHIREIVRYAIGLLVVAP